MEDIIIVITMYLAFTTAAVLGFIDISANIGECILEKDKTKLNSNIGWFLLVMIYVREIVEDKLHDMYKALWEECVNIWNSKYSPMGVRLKTKKKKQAMMVRQHLSYGKANLR